METGELRVELLLSCLMFGYELRTLFFFLLAEEEKKNLVTLVAKNPNVQRRAQVVQLREFPLGISVSG